MTVCEATTENSGRMLKWVYGVIWISMIGISSSTGSIQKIVP